MDLEIEQIADYGDLCGEGPLWNSSEQSLYWTDLARKRFYRYSWAEKSAKIVSERLQISGYAFRETGGLVVTNVAGIWLWNPGSEPVLLASDADGKPCCMNDCVADPEGRVYSGSYRKNPQTGMFEPGAGNLFRVDWDGSVHVVDSGLRLSNGLGFSPDCSTLYLVDSADRCIYAYDWVRVTGELKNRRTLIRVPMSEGFPDGMTVDVEGYLWAAHWFSGCLLRYDPDGIVERRVSIPVSQVSSVTFGGPDFTHLFVTSAGELDAVDLAPDGFTAGSLPVGGPVFKIRSEVQGRAEFPAKVECKQ